MVRRLAVNEIIPGSNPGLPAIQVRSSAARASVSKTDDGGSIPPASANHYESDAADALRYACEALALSPPKVDPKPFTVGTPQRGKSYAQAIWTEAAIKQGLIVGYAYIGADGEMHVDRIVAVDLARPIY